MTSARCGVRKAVAAAVVFLLTVTAGADVIQIDRSAQALLAGDDIWVGSGGTVAGSAAAGGEFDAGSGVALQSVYARSSIWLGDDATVRGTVLSNSKAEASHRLDFSGPSWTGAGVWFGSDAAVQGDVLSSGSVSINSRALIAGDLRSNSTIWISSNSTVDGDVSTGINKSLSTGSNVTITGQVSRQALMVDTLGAIDLGEESDHASRGNTNISRGRYSTTTLQAGAYRDVSIDDHSVLNLSAGTYTLREFWADDHTTVNVDTTGGDVIIDALDGFDLGDRVRFVTTGPGKLVVNVWGDDVWFGDDVEMPGEVRVWEGDFGAGNNLSFMGSIWASDDISLGSNSSIGYANWASPVPEPTTTALLVVGGALLMRRRRKAAEVSR